MRIRALHALFALIALTAPVTVTAAGIEVSPSRLEMGPLLHADIVVANPTADVQIFEVYPDGFSDRISADPASFTLEAGGRARVRVTVSEEVRRESPSIATYLSVVGRPLADSRFQADTGVKIPIIITGSGADRARYLRLVAIGALILGVATGAIFLIAHRRDRRNRHHHLTRFF